MLSTSIEFGVDHVVFADGSALGGRRLRGVFEITNSKCNFHRSETRKQNERIISSMKSFVSYQDP